MANRSGHRRSAAAGQLGFSAGISRSSAASARSGERFIASIRSARAAAPSPSGDDAVCLQSASSFGSSLS